MKNYLVLFIFILCTGVSEAQESFMLQLLPNQTYTFSMYRFVRRNQPGALVQASFKLADTSSSRLLRDFNPKTVKSTWTLDPTRVDHIIQTPRTPEFTVLSVKKDSIVNSIFDIYYLWLTVTTTPKANDTITINVRQNETITLNRTIKQTLDIPNFDGLGNTYKIPTPDGLQRIKLVLRDSNLAWMRLNVDSFALSRTDSVRTVQMQFSSPVGGNFVTYMATYQQYRGFPTHTLIRFNVSGGTATEEVQDESVKIFPNPVNDYFSIESEALIEQYHIFDLSGKCLYSATVNSHNAQINSVIPKGTYLLKLQTTKGLVTKKLVVKP